MVNRNGKAFGIVQKNANFSEVSYACCVVPMTIMKRYDDHLSRGSRYCRACCCDDHFHYLLRRKKRMGEM